MTNKTTSTTPAIPVSALPFLASGERWSSPWYLVRRNDVRGFARRVIAPSYSGVGELVVSDFTEYTTINRGVEYRALATTSDLLSRAVLVSERNAKGERVTASVEDALRCAALPAHPSNRGADWA